MTLSIFARAARDAGTAGHPTSAGMRSAWTGAMTMFCPTIPESGIGAGVGVVDSGFEPPQAAAAVANTTNRRSIDEK